MLQWIVCVSEWKPRFQDIPIKREINNQPFYFRCWKYHAPYKNTILIDSLIINTFRKIKGTNIFNFLSLYFTNTTTHDHIFGIPKKWEQMLHYCIKKLSWWMRVAISSTLNSTRPPIPTPWVPLTLKQLISLTFITCQCLTSNILSMLLNNICLTWDVSLFSICSIRVHWWTIILCV